MQFPIVLAKGAGIVTLEVYEDNGTMVCGIRQLDGWLALPPKQWVATMREHLGKIAAEAKSAGCGELRLTGRDWSKVFPHLEPIEGLPNGLRMRL